MRVPISWVERLATLHDMRVRLIKHRDKLDPGRTKDFYQDCVDALTDEIYKIEKDYGIH